MIKSNKDKIIKLFKFNKDPILPKKVATLLNIKESTVRSILSRLAKEGVLISDADGIKGFYKLNPLSQNLTDGINDAYNNMRFQNIVATINLDKEINFIGYVREYPFGTKSFWKIKVDYGKVNKKISIYLSGKAGFEPLSVLIIVDLIIKEINIKYNLELDVMNIKFPSIELFKDYLNIKLPNTVTFGIMNKWSLKIYNKKFGVRYEEKTFLDIPYDMLLNSTTNPLLLNYVKDFKEFSFILNNLSDKIDNLTYKIDNLSNKT